MVYFNFGLFSLIFSNTRCQLPDASRPLAFSGDFCPDDSQVMREYKTKLFGWDGLYPLELFTEHSSPPHLKRIFTPLSGRPRVERPWDNDTDTFG
jgi:hypothetical protein